MRMIAGLWSIVLALVIGGAHERASSATPAAATVAIDADDIGGLVTSSKGPEAGVWVIAETTDLPTKFARIVVTGDDGRYLIPGSAEGELRRVGAWLRTRRLGARAQRSGTALDLAATPATDPRAAAHYYPSGYWFSLMQVPPKSDFPGTGANGIDPAMKTQADWLRTLKSGTCWACHALGTKATREIPAVLDAMSPTDAWQRRILSGQAGANMMQGMSALGMGRALTMFADWSTRIAKGEVPPAPPRPQGIERSIVITEWDWADPKAYLHDEVSTDRRNPRLNAERPHLRLAGAQRRLPAGARSRAEQRQPRAADGPRSGDAADVARDGHAVAQLGHRSRRGPAATTSTTRCSTRRGACG